MYSYLKSIVYDKFLNPRQSFRIILYLLELVPVSQHTTLQNFSDFIVWCCVL